MFDSTIFITFLLRNHHVWEKYQAVFEIWLSSPAGQKSLDDYKEKFDHRITTDPNVEMSEDIYDFIMSILSKSQIFVQYSRLLNHYAARWVILQELISDMNEISLSLLTTLLQKQFPTLSQLTLTQLLPIFLKDLQYNHQLPPMSSSSSSSSSSTTTTPSSTLLTPNSQTTTSFKTLTLVQLSDLLTAGVVPDLHSRLSVFSSLGTPVTTTSSTSSSITTPSLNPSTTIKNNSATKSSKLVGTTTKTKTVNTPSISTNPIPKKSEVNLLIPIDNNIAYKQVEIVISGAIEQLQEIFLTEIFQSSLYVLSIHSVANIFIKIYNITSNEQQPLPHLKFIPQDDNNNDDDCNEPTLASTLITLLQLNNDGAAAMTKPFQDILYSAQKSIHLWGIDLLMLWIQQMRLISLLIPPPSNGSDSDKILSNITTHSTTQVVNLSTSLFSLQSPSHSSTTKPSLNRPASTSINPPKQELIGVLAATFVCCFRVLGLEPPLSATAKPNLTSRSIKLNSNHLRQLVTMITYLNLTLKHTMLSLPKLKPGVEESPFTQINSILQSTPYLTLMSPHPLIEAAIRISALLSTYLFSSTIPTTLTTIPHLPRGLLIPLTDSIQFTHSSLEQSLQSTISLLPNNQIDSTSEDFTTFKKLLGPTSLFHIHSKDLLFYLIDQQ